MNQQGTGFCPDIIAEKRLIRMQENNTQKKNFFFSKLLLKEKFFWY